MEQVKIKVSTKLNGALIDPPFIVQVERPTTLDEAHQQGWTDEDIVSHLSRDENSNVGNACRAALVAAIEAGTTDTAELQKAVNEAATAYESGERTVRSRGGAANLLGKAIKWACSNAEVAAAYASAIASDGLEAANKVVTELYSDAHPAKVKEAAPVVAVAAK